MDSGQAHFIAALAALALGPVVLLRPKGTNLHRLLGRIWVSLMLAVNLSALSQYDLDGRPNLFHAFALLSLWALIPGFIAVRRFAKTRQQQHLTTHQICMHWAYFGLAAAGVWQVATGWLPNNSIAFNLALAAMGLLTGLAGWYHNRWLLHRFAS